MHARIPLLLRFLAKKKVGRGLSGALKHMKEEGENLKLILELDEHSHDMGINSGKH